jgi:hypothetical protein
MDSLLVASLIERDWDPFVVACRTLAVGTPSRDGERILIPCRPSGTDDEYLAVIECDDYDAEAPLLDFANPDDPSVFGRPWWPNMQGAPYNGIVIGNRDLPILCVKGTRGYHLHSSHSAEQYERSSWRLPVTATLLHRLLHQWGPYVKRGL